SVARVDQLVIEPLGSIAGMSMSLSATPLWDPRVLTSILNDTDNERNARLAPAAAYEGADPQPPQPLQLLWSAARDHLEPTNIERIGRWNPVNGVVDDGAKRVTARTVVRALYQPLMGPARGTPEEVDLWLEANNRGVFQLPGTAFTDPARRPGFPPPDMARLKDIATRGAEVTRVMATEDRLMDGNGRENRFVSYALLRGLTADFGPNEHGDADGDGHINRLRYTRGSSRDRALMQSRPAALPATRNEELGPSTPPVLIAQWRERDGNQAELTQRLIAMIEMTGPALPGDGSALAGVGQEFEVSVRMSDGVRLDDNEQHVQSMTNTVREVRWAPIQQSRPIAGGDANKRANVPSYTAGARAASAAATYEHLIDNLHPAQGYRNEHTNVSEQLRTSLRAALKLKQLPHMIAFDASMIEKDSDMQRVMTDQDRRRVEAGGDGGQPWALRTILPTRREHGRNLHEIVPSAFSGVWPVRHGWVGLEANWGTRTPEETMGLLGQVQFDLGSGLGGVRDTQASLDELARLTQAAGQDGTAVFPAPTWGLAVAHLPTGVPVGPFADGPKTLGAQKGDVHRLSRAGPPQWMRTDADVEGVVAECHRFASSIRALRAQRASFATDADGPGDDAPIQSYVERERRGAIWEDALREMSISSDRLYNFLRSMAGTLHEDVNAVVEVEVCYAIRTTHSNPQRDICSLLSKVCPLVRRTTRWRRPTGSCASGGRRC
ncbi:MAG: hypothetical protein ACKVI4_15850, partial [Actinomycetales bacterium]